MLNINKIVIYALSFMLVFFTIGASCYLKTSVYRLEKELVDIKQNIQSDEETIHV